SLAASVLPPAAIAARPSQSRVSDIRAKLRGITITSSLLSTRLFLIGASVLQIGYQNTPYVFRADRRSRPPQIPGAASPYAAARLSAEYRLRRRRLWKTFRDRKTEGPENERSRREVPQNGPRQWLLLYG